MAKTVLEQLTEAITTAISMRDAAIIGDQEGQYSQEHVHSLTASIESVQGIAGNASSEQPQLEKALTDINAAIVFFKGSVIKPPRKSQDKQESVSLKGVVLKGTSSEKKGPHMIFAYDKAIMFHDGVAELNSELADKLISDGYAEEVKLEDGE